MKTRLSPAVALLRPAFIAELLHTNTSLLHRLCVASNIHSACKGAQSSGHTAERKGGPPWHPSLLRFSRYRPACNVDTWVRSLGCHFWRFTTFCLGWVLRGRTSFTTSPPSGSPRQLPLSSRQPTQQVAYFCGQIHDHQRSWPSCGPDTLLAGGYTTLQRHFNMD